MNAKFTGTQIAIIAALTLAVVVVFCIGGILILSILSATPKPSEQQVLEIAVTPQVVSVSPTLKSAPTVQPSVTKPIVTAPPAPIVQPSVAKPAVTAPPAPTSTSSNPSLTFESIINAAKQLTELKRNEYYKSLIGKSIHWSGKVADVSDNGEIDVRIVSTISYDVAVQGVPKSTYTMLNLNDPVEFDGMITEVSDIFGSGRPTITVKSTALNSQANIVNPTATRANQSLTYADITATAKQLTEIKRNDYYKSLVGKTIRDTGKVADVSDKGDIHIRIVATMSYDIILQGTAKTIYTKLNLNDPVDFNGTIVVVDDMFGSGRPTITVKSTP